MTTPAQNRIAGAPISWGVCEVPNWGYQLTPERVLAEMQDVGLSATELGPDGFLPADPQQMADGARHPPADRRRRLHSRPDAPGRARSASRDRPDPRRLRRHRRRSRWCSRRSPGLDGYDTARFWTTTAGRCCCDNLDRISAVAAEHGVRAVLHPHVGTMVENGDEVQRVLDGSSISLCLDTGHLLIGGTDPAELTRQAPDRIAHTHLKDVDNTIADKVRAGRLTYTDAVTAGHVPAAGHR